MERSAAASYLVCAEGPPFLAIGPMDKNAQLHWTFRWPSCPVCNNYEFCVLWPSNAVLRKVVPTATCLPKRAEVVTRPGGNAARQPAAVLDRYGGLRRRASSQSQAPNAWPRRPPDAGEIRAPLFEGTEE